MQTSPKLGGDDGDGMNALGFYSILRRRLHRVVHLFICPIVIPLDSSNSTSPPVLPKYLPATSISKVMPLFEIIETWRTNHELMWQILPTNGYFEPLGNMIVEINTGIDVSTNV